MGESLKKRWLSAIAGFFDLDVLRCYNGITICKRDDPEGWNG